ncbi:hypothetical protein DYB37_001056 [Aphanomyces astaci]|uniref:tryptophan synthase n=1 Tax=Aphanomyces astaci TaxID=112090 RepID=A0A3R6XDE0_APHAT|nr:hypothetical protein DYB35_003339 [Aphanomyces astaci]RHZ24153.1 hypothetical protein DYB37_001056 [Aphanomyces astaci]RQM26270.1 hypothetical protein B5M09_003158 [Aphanomyces astaci]
MHYRIDATFARCKQEGKTAFITFIPCGYKEKADTIPILLACQAGGADIIEVQQLSTHLRKHISLPLALGFGLSSKAHVQAAGKLVDGAVIGSKIVNVIDEAPRDQRAQKVKDFCLSITQ